MEVVNFIVDILYYMLIGLNIVITLYFLGKLLDITKEQVKEARGIRTDRVRIREVEVDLEVEHYIKELNKNKNK